jgi:hypothetical protein
VREAILKNGFGQHLINAYLFSILATGRVRAAADRMNITRLS